MAAPSYPRSLAAAPRSTCITSKQEDGQVLHTINLVPPPKRRARRAKAKTKPAMRSLAQTFQMALLKNRLAARHVAVEAVPEPVQDRNEGDAGVNSAVQVSYQSSWEAPQLEDDLFSPMDMFDEDHSVIERYRRKRTDPSQKELDLHRHWEEIIGELKAQCLAYDDDMHSGRECMWDSVCNNEMCTKKVRTVICVSWKGDVHQSHVALRWLMAASSARSKRQFRCCQHALLPSQLVRAGFFPTAPIQPNIAFAIDLLDFYLQLFHHCGVSILAFARAL